MTSTLLKSLTALAAAAALTACASNDAADTIDPIADEGRGGFFGFGGGDDKAQLGVNAYLWRASLDTLSFMPIIQADDVNGTILTDWYIDPAATGERFKVQVFILDTRLRADALKVAVNRQVRGPTGDWIAGETNPQTGMLMENAILNRARELRISNIE